MIYVTILLAIILSMFVYLLMTGLDVVDEIEAQDEYDIVGGF